MMCINYETSLYTTHFPHLVHVSWVKINIIWRSDNILLLLSQHIGITQEQLTFGNVLVLLFAH